MGFSFIEHRFPTTGCWRPHWNSTMHETTWSTTVTLEQCTTCSKDEVWIELLFYYVYDCHEKRHILIDECRSLKPYIFTRVKRNRTTARELYVCMNAGFFLWARKSWLLSFPVKVVFLLSSVEFSFWALLTDIRKVVWKGAIGSS